MTILRKKPGSLAVVATAVGVFLLAGLGNSLCRTGRSHAAERNESADATDQRHELRIVPDAKADWGGDLDDVHAVLASAARQLWKHFPDRRLPIILVEPKGGPITLFQRGEHGEIRVRLDTGDRLWAQHAFQFSHEFCHVMCNYREGRNPNLWFEESVCELASLYCLRQMAAEWKDSPPYPNWKDYGPKLADYADERMKKAELTDGKTLAAWYLRHSQQLAENPTQRELNEVVAVALLPIFEKSPEHWEAVTWLNGDRPHGEQTLAEYLSEWRNRSPERHRASIDQIAAQFGESGRISASRKP